MICVVVLQNCMGFVEGETGSCNETGVECDVDGSEEVSTKAEEVLDIKEEVIIKVEESIDIKEEIPEAISFPLIKTEQEVRLWGVCEVVAGHAFGASALEQFCATAVKQLQRQIISWLCTRTGKETHFLTFCSQSSAVSAYATQARGICSVTTCFMTIV